MGYRLSNLERGYFVAPQALFDGGRFANLTPAECKLLMCLYAAMNRHSSPRIRVSGSQLEKVLGMDAKTIRAARSGLSAKGYVFCKRAEKAGGPYEFHLLNPETGEPFPPEAGRSAVVDYKPIPEQADANKPKNGQRCALRGPRAARTAEGGPTHVSQPPKPPEGPQTLSGPRPNLSGKCPLHPEAKSYFDSKGMRHCAKCEPSPYLPPDEVQPKPAGSARQMTWDDMYAGN